MNIETRIARLESQNRWLRVTVLAALMAAIVPWAMGNRLAPDLVTATQFELVNDQGETVGKWRFDPDTDSTILMLSTGIEREPAIRIENTHKSAAIVITGGASTGQRATFASGPMDTRLTIEGNGKVRSLPARMW
jgi:hypothetical protein